MFWNESEEEKAAKFLPVPVLALTFRLSFSLHKVFSLAPNGVELNSIVFLQDMNVSLTRYYANDRKVILSCLACKL